MMATRLKADRISRDIVTAFTEALDAAKSGQAVGVIFGIELKGRRYVVNAAGTLARDPTFARGVCAALDDELSAMVRSRRDPEPI